jgi:3-deoxy-D-manno-octulosonate 8-phosphate phosphatase (KDO 8-P phosphatase)
MEIKMGQIEKLKKIKLLILDVDGVLTDTRIFLDSDGEWKRFFSIRDGVGIKELQKRGYETAVITGSKAKDITERMKILGITYFYDGFLDKEPAFKKLLEDSKLSPHEMAYIGDDIYDIPLLTNVGYAATVPEAVTEVKDIVDYITERPGGLGAAREICDQIIKHGFFSSEVR